MKKSVHFTVWGPGVGLAPEIKDAEAYQAFRSRAAELGFPKATIKCAPDDPNLQILLQDLESLGWKAHHGYVTGDLKGTHFHIRTIVEYDKADIDAAPLLYLPARWALWPLTSFVRRNGKRWVGHSRAGVGKLTKQGWGQTHGSVDGVYNYFVHPKVREHFEKAGLHLHYHPLEWDEPQRAKGEFWEIDTEHVMPPCLNPIISWEDGTRVYEDAGCEPEELRFRRGEVAEMGDFDAAWTREDLSNPNDPRDGGRRLVVTQRFRQVCQDYKLKSVSFFPVRLVDEF